MFSCLGYSLKGLKYLLVPLLFLTTCIEGNYMAAKFGSCTLGGAHYSRPAIAKHPQGQVGAVFLRTFKYSRPFIVSMLRSGKYSEIVVHLAPFDYSHNYPINSTLPQVLKDAADMEALQKQFPGTLLMLSPYCEHNHNARAMKPVLDAVKSAAPNCEVVNSIWKGQEVPGYITEIHIPNSKQLPRVPRQPYTVSFDGFGGDGSGDFTDTDVVALLNRYKSARHIRWWNFRCNGKFGHKDTATLANRKHWPNGDYLAGHYAMMKYARAVPLWKETDRLYKPFSDDHGNVGVSKDNKAMVILPLPLSVKRIEVLDVNDKLIGHMDAPRVNPMHQGQPKGMRYYSPIYAYRLGNQAERSSGVRAIKFRAGNFVTAPTDADLRSGRFK